VRDGGNVIEILKWLFSDACTFALFEVGLICTVLYAYWREWRATKSKREGTAVVQRGEQSWAQLALAYGIASVLVIQIINAANTATDYKILFSLLDLVGLLYLVFFNAWFRNTIIGLVARSKQKKERF
jgi:hypothetical protein